MKSLTEIIAESENEASVFVVKDEETGAILGVFDAEADAKKEQSEHAKLGGNITISSEKRSEYVKG